MTRGKRKDKEKKTERQSEEGRKMTKGKQRKESGKITEE